MSSPQRFGVVLAATVPLMALAAYSLAEAQYYTNFEIPTSTCIQANCANCRQGKLNNCPICCNPADPHYIGPNNPAVCFSVKNSSTTVVGAWCGTAGSNTQGCVPLTLNSNNPNQCGQVNVWHCFPCLSATADCMNNVCPCTPGNQETFTIDIGAQQYTCTDVTAKAQ